MRKHISGMLSLFLGCAMTELPPGLLERLEKPGVTETPRILVVDVAGQKLTIFDGRQPKSEHRISTALNGAGSRLNSHQTPLGLHRIKERVGKDAPPGAIFNSREFTGRIWRPPAPPPVREEPATPRPTDAETAAAPAAVPVPESDLITSRILWLEGLDPGYNAGKDADGVVVDSHERYIYIHGTNHESDIGRPASRGCIRMLNAEVITLFDQTREGDLVWIQE